ncbi:MAG: multicopper oxidase family protein [Deinococcales bacterium]
MMTSIQSPFLDKPLSRRAVLQGGLKLATATGLALTFSQSFAAVTEEQGKLIEGIRHFELEAHPALLKVGSSLVQTWSYNGSFPGPILRMTEGERVRIRFSNNLEEVTNLHFHGLHIPPTGTGDDVFREVMPGESVMYDFVLPEKSAGCYWYHPHVHGKVHSQLFKGLAGAIIVEAKEKTLLDEIPEVLWVLKDISSLRNGFIPEATMMDMMMGREGDVISLNGEIGIGVGLEHPQCRLKLLNASNARFYRLHIPNAKLWLLATDGHYLSQAKPVEELLITPGERYELLVELPEAGRYGLEMLPYNRSPEMGMMGMSQMPSMSLSSDQNNMHEQHMQHMQHMQHNMTNPDTPNTSVLGYLELNTHQEGKKLDFEAANTILKDLAPPALKLEDVTTTREFIFSEDMMALQFLINGQSFDHMRIDTQVNLGDVELWRIINTTGMDHSFHLHVYPFQLYRQQDESLNEIIVKDTVNVPAGQSVEVLVAFRDFAGKTLYHCHVVEHEDLGMMGLLEVLG